MCTVVQKKLQITTDPLLIDSDTQMYDPTLNNKTGESKIEINKSKEINEHTKIK